MEIRMLPQQLLLRYDHFEGRSDFILAHFWTELGVFLLVWNQFLLLQMRKTIDIEWILTLYSQLGSTPNFNFF